MAKELRMGRKERDRLKVIEHLKHQTTGSVRLERAAIFLDILENLLECYKNAMAAVDDYEIQQRLAGTIGHQIAHARHLRGWSASASHASRKAFEHAVYQSSAGKAKLKVDLVDFSRAIDSEAEARSWGMKLRAQTQQLHADLKAAQKDLRLYAEQYATAMDALATKYKLMLPHQNKLLTSYKAIVDYELRKFGLGRHGSLVGHMPGHLSRELMRYDDVLFKAQARLAVTAEMSQSRLRAQ